MMGDLYDLDDPPRGASELLARARGSLLPKVYISGPMTGYREFNFPAFDALRDRINEDGWYAISPADMDRADGFDETGMRGDEMLSAEARQRFARNDLHALLIADFVYLLPGWRQSRGACNEVMVAGWLGLPVYEMVSDIGDPVLRMARVGAVHHWSGNGWSDNDRSGHD